MYKKQGWEKNWNWWFLTFFKCWSFKRKILKSFLKLTFFSMICLTRACLISTKRNEKWRAIVVYMCGKGNWVLYFLYVICKCKAVKLTAFFCACRNQLQSITSLIYVVVPSVKQHFSLLHLKKLWCNIQVFAFIPLRELTNHLILYPIRICAHFF